MLESLRNDATKAQKVKKMTFCTYEVCLVLTGLPASGVPLAEAALVGAMGPEVDRDRRRVCRLSAHLRRDE